MTNGTWDLRDMHNALQYDAWAKVCAAIERGDVRNWKVQQIGGGPRGYLPLREHLLRCQRFGVYIDWRKMWRMIERHRAGRSIT